MTVLTKKISYQQFCQMEFDENDTHVYELLNGEIVKRSAPKPIHQKISKRLLRIVDNFVEKRKMGEILYAPIDVFLDEFNAPQPDLVFVSKEKEHIINDEKGIIGIPDLVVEIISPSSVKRDRIDKMKLYHQFKIKEYWLIDPNNQTIEIYEYTEKAYELLSFAVETGKVKSNVLAKLKLDAKDIF